VCIVAKFDQWPNLKEECDWPHNAANLEPLAPRSFRCVALQMMLGRTTEPPRKKLLTMDQRNGSQDIFISISGLIGKSNIRRVFRR